MRLDFETFAELMPAEYISAKQKYISRENIREQERWEMTRWQVFRTVCPPAAKSGLLRVADFIVFPWEAEKEKKILQKADPDYVRKLIEKWDKK